MKKALVGYQLYSAREDAEKDLLGVLQSLKALGYDGVELAGFYGHAADEIAAMLAKTGLTAFSSHVPYTAIRQDMRGVIAEHLRIGCKHIAVPYLDEDCRPGKPGFAEVIRTIFSFGELCRAAGITLLYHNHDFEFAELSGGYALDFLYACIPDTLLKTEIDTCWVKFAGLEPCAYLRKYSGRAPVVHLKDYVLGSEGEIRFQPVGHGCQDMAAVVQAGLNAGAAIFIVEQDFSYERTPLEAAQLSLEHLRKIGL